MGITHVTAGTVVGVLFCWSLYAATVKPPKLAKDDKTRADELRSVIAKLAPLHKKLPKPKPGDWLARFKEPGQTFDQYLRCRPVLPRGKRRTIYVQPLGNLTKTQRKVIALTGEFMGLYFNLPVKTTKDLPLRLIPDKARRTHPTWGDRQILTTYVLDKVLLPRLPGDAAVYIALTASDLWPGKGWNFVFGQASLVDRVGVWSIYRNGDPDKNDEAFRLCLLRTMKTATHETGHMFSMLHCIAYECNMCGSNNRGESDRRPLALCPQCLAKTCWATRTDPLERFKALTKFCTKHKLKPEADFFDRCIKVLTPAPTRKTNEN